MTISVINNSATKLPMPVLKMVYWISR